MTECLDSMSDWASAYMWSCRSAYTMKNSNFGDSTDLFMSEIFVGRPGPTLNEPGVLEVANDNMVDCFQRGAGKSCHIIGQVYLFGEAFIHGTPLNDEEIAFAKVSFPNDQFFKINFQFGQSEPFFVKAPFLTSFLVISIDAGQCNQR